jgi:hypothetical protein
VCDAPSQASVPPQVMTMLLLQSTTEWRSAEHPRPQLGSGASIVLLPSSSPVVGRGAGPHATKITHPQVRSLIAATVGRFTEPLQ